MSRPLRRWLFSIALFNPTAVFVSCRSAPPDPNEPLIIKIEPMKLRCPVSMCERRAEIVSSMFLRTALPLCSERLLVRIELK